MPTNQAMNPSGNGGPVLGDLVGLITRELGAAVAVVGGLSAGFMTIAAAQRAGDDHQWQMYLVAGAIFVSVAVVCRWRGRA